MSEHNLKRLHRSIPLDDELRMKEELCSAIEQATNDLYVKTSVVPPSISIEQACHMLKSIYNSAEDNNDE